VLVGESVNAPLQTADQLFKRIEVAPVGLPYELAGRYGSRVRSPGHGERFGPWLGIHQR
jgi:hypothetical protein